jgi:hypothetical protein
MPHPSAWPGARRPGSPAARPRRRVGQAWHPEPRRISPDAIACFDRHLPAGRPAACSGLGGNERAARKLGPAARCWPAPAGSAEQRPPSARGSRSSPGGLRRRPLAPAVCSRWTLQPPPICDSCEGGRRSCAWRRPAWTPRWSRTGRPVHALSQDAGLSAWNSTLPPASCPLALELYSCPLALHACPGHALHACPGRKGLQCRADGGQAGVACASPRDACCRVVRGGRSAVGAARRHVHDELPTPAYVAALAPGQRRRRRADAASIGMARGQAAGQPGRTAPAARRPGVAPRAAQDLAGLAIACFDRHLPAGRPAAFSGLGGNERAARKLGPAARCWPAPAGGVCRVSSRPPALSGTRRSRGRAPQAARHCNPQPLARSRRQSAVGCGAASLPCAWRRLWILPGSRTADQLRALSRGGQSRPLRVSLVSTCTAEQRAVV